MDIFGILTMVGGLALFLFGMNAMGQGLEKLSGSRLERILEKMTSNPFKAIMLGALVTAVIQSSSATTVMVVGFVNSGIMRLSQAIGVIMGANIGTTMTSWLLSLTGIQGESIFMQLLKPTSFTPILAIIGIFFIMMSKSSKKKDIGTILMGFAILMFGMETMSSAVAPLADNEQFKSILTMFSNPVLGVIAGAVLTAVIQSSSASVGILQAMCATGAVTYSTALPIIMGQNIGTCVTALLSAIGANKNAKRAAIVHLSFNVIGTVVWLTVFTIVSYVFKPLLFDTAASYLGIAVAHSLFNILCTALLFPAAPLLEKIAVRLVPDGNKKDTISELDDRLLATPAIALEQCERVVETMAEETAEAFKLSMDMLTNYDADSAGKIRKAEDNSDHLEDIIGTYLTKLSRNQLTEDDSAEVSKLLKAIGDFERISDHSVNILESAEELRSKKIEFTGRAKAELGVLCSAVSEILTAACAAFRDNDPEKALKIEPLEQVIDDLKVQLRDRHIARLKNGECTVEAGFIWSDILTNLERASDHCSNIALCVIDAGKHNMNMHESLSEMKKDNPAFEDEFDMYTRKYRITG